MSEYQLKTPKKVEDAVVGTYHKIEDMVVGAYKKVEDGAVSGYKKVEKRFVDAFLERTEEPGPHEEESPEGEARVLGN